ncbi:hypothetical protein M758_1G264100 [Ceratodon purpureus]|uniref:Uncharacterized protein n=1 Tax=Ceratodon purpureus TaxID=3225 RepID=A0A8T0JB07_CERPU|nr:hypothetical protein KC19_1G271900 [Ceratodon purpureus]KAG0631584.1 hypothetical protein M758_1G264100 [Ceratodon purpureus]
MRRPSTPNPGYSGRRSSHGYAGPPESKGEMGNIWELVSALANTLQDARNQLMNLMNTSNSNPMYTSPKRGPPMRLSGGRRESYECCYSRSGTPGRTDSPYPGVRNVHRAHAQGHVAFGTSSEYPLHATPKRVRPRETYGQMSAQQTSAPAPPRRRCTHPLHGIGAEARNLRRAQPISQWPSGQVKGCTKSHNDELGQRERRTVNCTSDKNQEGSNGSRNASPDRRRHHCMAEKFASLLAHETHQQQERRIAEEYLRDKRPAWCRF